MTSPSTAITRRRWYRGVSSSAVHEPSVPRTNCDSFMNSRTPFTTLSARKVTVSPLAAVTS